MASPDFARCSTLALPFGDKVRQSFLNRGRTDHFNKKNSTNTPTALTYVRFLIQVGYKALIMSLLRIVVWMHSLKRFSSCITIQKANRNSNVLYRMCYFQLP